MGGGCVSFPCFPLVSLCCRVNRLLPQSLDDFLLGTLSHAQPLQQDDTGGISNARTIFVQCNIEDDPAEVGLLRASHDTKGAMRVLRIDEFVKLLAQIGPDILILGAKIGCDCGELLPLPLAMPSLPLRIAKCHV